MNTLFSTIIVLSIVIVSFISGGDCLGQKPTHIDIPEKGRGICKASSFAHSVNYVPLETKPESLIGGMISKIDMNDSLIVVSDMVKILVFNRNGKFLRQIGHNGNGPGEFVLVMDFILKGDILYITSSAKTAVSKYNIQGKFLGDISQKSHPLYICTIPKGGFASYNRYTGSVVYHNNNFKITNTLITEYNVSPNRTKYMSGSTSDRFFFIENDKLLFTTYRNDTIWDVSARTKSPYYIFNLKDKLLPDNKQIEYCNGDIKRYEANAGNYQKLDIFLINSHLLLLQRTWNEKTRMLSLYNKKTHFIEKFERNTIYDDLTGGIHLGPEWLIKGQIISALRPDEIQEQIRKQKADIKTSQFTKFKSQMLALGEEDNPILAIIK